MRARSAYAATEAAEAALRMAKEQGIISSTHTDEEYRKLRSRLDEMTRRADESQRALRTAEADLAALRAGVESDAVADPLDAVREPVGAAIPPGTETPAPENGERGPIEAVEGHEAEEDAPTEPGEPAVAGATVPTGSDTWAASTRPSKGLGLRRLAGAGGRRSKGSGDTKR
jgi:hypothetical protein